MQDLLNQRFPKQQILQSAAFLGCGMLLSLLGYSSTGPGPLVAASLCVLWSVTGLLVQIRGALAVLLFAAVHLPSGLSIGLACFLIGIGIAIVDFVFTPDSSLPQKLRPLRNELRDAEFQQDILHRHIARYPVLLDSCTLLSGAQELGQLAKMLCEQSKKFCPSYAQIGVFFGKGERIYCSYAIDNKNKIIELDVGERETYVIKESRLLVLREDTINHVYIPLRGERRQESADNQHGQNGALFMSFRSAGIDDEFIIDILRALGRLAGLTLASVNLMEEARELALHDDLTGLYGRHEYQRRLEEQIAHCRRNSLTLGLVMCDMDYLKKFNDRYGHQCGDEALKAIAKAINDQLPEDGVACRFGGEEFSAFIATDSPDGIKQLSDSLHAAIRDTTLSVDDHLTASIGWTYLQENDTVKDLIKRADEACYKAKDSGRDQVIEADHA